MLYLCLHYLYYLIIYDQYLIRTNKRNSLFAMQCQSFSFAKIPLGLCRFTTNMYRLLSYHPIGFAKAEIDATFAALIHEKYTLNCLIYLNCLLGIKATDKVLEYLLHYYPREYSTLVNEKKK